MSREPPQHPAVALGCPQARPDGERHAVTLTVPIRTISEANRSRQEHWAVTAKRVKRQRDAVAWCWQTIPQVQRLAVAQALDTGGLVVTLTRVAPRSLDDDNLARSLKAVRDQVAKQLAVDDRSPLVAWRYGLRRGERNVYAVEIQIEELRP